MHRLSPFRRATAVALLLVAALIAPPLAAQVREDEMAVGPNIEKEDFFRAGIAPVRAPVGYNLTIVYFMDYQCPSCRQYTPDVARALAEDRKVRVIYRDTPIISDLSTVAARAAIAASFQGRHEAFHHALMMTKGQLTEALIRAAANKAKVDWARLQRDLTARGEAIDLQIGRNVELAVATGILGTPAFIVGDRLSNGALDYASLKAEIADARAAESKNRKVAAEDPASAKGAIPVPTSAETDASVITNATSATPTAPSLFRETTAVPKATASEPTPGGGGWPLPLLAGAAVIAVIGGAWLVQRRKAARRG